MFSPRVAFLLLASIALGADFRSIARQTRGVVVIEVELRNGRGAGAGFAVGDGTVVATAHHVVDGARAVRVRLDDDTELAVTEVLALDPKHDLALLKVDRPAPALVSSGPPPAPGSPVLAVGNPQALGLAFTDGIVSRVHDLREIQVIQHSAPISPGNSGGPLLDSDGQVVGVNSFQLAAELGQNVNFAIASEHLRALLAEPGRHRPAVAVVLRPPAPSPSRPAAAWTAPEGQPRCASPEELTWPFPEAVPLHELAAVRTDPLGVCRHGRPAPGGPHLVFARYSGVDARDEGLDRLLGELGSAPTDPGDPCRRSGRFRLGSGEAEVRTARNRDLLYVWLRAEGGDGDALCDLAARIRDAARP